MDMTRNTTIGMMEFSDKAERKTSIGGYTSATVDSTPASSSMVEKIHEPIGRNDIQLEMHAMMMQRMKKESGQPHFPSAASLGSSIWSSSGNSSDHSGSYAWSTSLNSETDDDSDFSSSYSGSDETSTDDEENDRVPPLGGKSYPQPPPGMGGRSYPQPPPGMMEGLPLGLGGLPLSLESLKKDLEKVGRAILSSNAGGIAQERAQTLASINWLASHVPNAVLDQLGHETRTMVASEKAGKVDSDNESQDSRVASVVESDAMSDVSDLSNENVDETEFEDQPNFDAADIPNVTQSYGDLAKYKKPTGSSLHSRPPPTIQSNIESPVKTPSTTGKQGILDILPHADEDTSLPFGVQGTGSIGFTSPVLTDTKEGKSKRGKGVKRLFKRLVRRKGDSSILASSSVEASSASEKDNSSNIDHSSNADTSSNAEDEALEREKVDIDMSVSLAELSKGDDKSSVTIGKRKEDGIKIKGKRLPYSSEYRCALLFVDISGFTKLSTKLDPESLSKAINSYFQLIVSVVLGHKGDLLKFAGDAVFCEWKAGHDINLESCVESASKCGTEIISRCADFSVLENGVNLDSGSLIATSGAAKVDTLNVHCGVGAGQMTGVHVGDHTLRREYLLLGQPIQQATVATDFAKLGEVAISPEAHALLSRVCHLDRDIARMTERGPIVIADRNKLKFHPRKRLGTHQPKIVNDVSRGVTKHVEGLETQDLKSYRRMMSLYVHPVVVDNDLAAANNVKRIKNIEKSAQERHREEAEIRNVYVMFVNPDIETKITKSDKGNRELFKRPNDIMNLSSREIKRYCGHLRQFIVDDKGLVMIITFGLRGTTIPNMVAQRALPATISIFNAIQGDLNIPCKIGATIGEAYCGVVGGVKRHEYAVLGPSVNLAARLMASKTNPGILVDNNVRLMAHRSFGFNALPPVAAKGYAEPVPIFEPLSPLERSWGKLQPNFVGRKDEIMQIMGLARDMVLKESPSKLVVVEAKSGMGKSTMVAHVIEHIRKLMGANKHRLIVTKNVSKESDSLVPFGIFRSILQDVLRSFRGSQDDKSYLSSGASIYSNMQNSIMYESLSGISSGQSTANLTEGKSADVLQSLCRELDMPPSFLDHILGSLLGLEKKAGGKQTRSKTPSARTMVSFLTRAFKRCTQDAKLVVVALDDLHEADEYSWKVIRELFETTTNVLFVGTTYPEETREMKVESNFWSDLMQVHKKAGRFVTIGLNPLTREEITIMIMKTLGLRRKEVKDDVLNGVSIQSGGLPHFVNEILEHVKRQMADDPEFEISDISYESFGDLVLQRLDNFDLTTRNILNMGGVLGLSFTLDEVVAVQMRNSDSPEAAVRKHAEEALQVAVEGGILECREVPDHDNENKVIKKYSFYHAVWRTALLNLMLEGRKRDLHRTIAETLEEQQNEFGDYMLSTKLFNHWICSHNFRKASQLALSVGKHFEERLGLPAQSIRLYNESLDLFREDNEKSDSIAGLSARVFEEIEIEDLTYIIRLQVALGQALALSQRMTESVTAYQDALRITQAAKSSRLLKDRSILFPIFFGLSEALKRGHIVQDAECRYEKAMVKRYVQEAKIHGDPINTIHAVTLQADMYARFGEYENAVECHKSEIEPLYDTEAHSLDLCDEYGNDLGAQSFSNSTIWNQQLGRVDDALGVCWFMVEELMPKLEKRNVHASFMIIYPVLWVMKDNGFALEARDFFDDFVCEAYTEYFGEGRSTFFLPLYDPVMMLLDLAGNTEPEEDMMEEYIDWAMDIDNLGFGTLINTKTGELGRTADSIAAEICYILSQRVDDEDQRNTLIQNGLEIACEDMEFTKEKKLVIAGRYTDSVLKKLKEES